MKSELLKRIKNRPYIIAEIGQAHEGSLALAFSFVEAAAKAGADAIKFQTHLAQHESTIEEGFRVPILGGQDQTRYDYWKRMEFSPSEWQRLKNHCSEHQIDFLSSPFSVEAVDILEDIGVPAFKVGSGEILSKKLFDRLLQTGKPLLVSSGMSAMNEIKALAEKIEQTGTEFCLFQCTSKYPTPFEEIGLNVIQEMQVLFPDVPIGLSDHSGSPFPSIAAISSGASLIEVHACFDREMFSLDAKASVTFSELKMICDYRNAWSIMKQSPVDKNRMAENLSKMRTLFGKSLALKTDLKAGTVLDENHLTEKKPSTGIAPSEIKNIIGKKLKHDVSSNRTLKYEDLEQ